MFDSLFERPGVLVQGITGKHGSFHTQQMLEAGTRILAGVTPGKSGMHVKGVPVYSSIDDARAAHDITISVVFVPAPFAKTALLEAIDGGIKLIVCITEGIPVHDMLEVARRAKVAEAILVGPNCPGILIPGYIKLGIIPTAVGTPGSVALVSRSGTLTYEAAAALSAAGAGQRYIVGIGGDRLHGISFRDCLETFEADTRVKKIILIGEIGGADEQQAATYIKRHVEKPVFAYIVGQTAKSDTQLGHAGAILGQESESAAAKTTALESAGVVTATSLPALIAAVLSAD